MVEHCATDFGNIQRDITSLSDVLKKGIQMGFLKKLIKRGLARIGNSLGLEDANYKLDCLNCEVVNLKDIIIDDYLQKYLYSNSKYADSKRLNKYEFQVYSQNGEAGIIAEIFNRIGTTNKFFVEFGVGNGLENNTLLLLLQGWKGYWLEGNEDQVIFIQQKFDTLIKEKHLVVKHTFITKEKIEEIFDCCNIPSDFDFLSIDIDGNDYYVWEAIKRFFPRVVAIEYNAMFRPPHTYVVAYDAKKNYKITSYFGASLKALEILGKKKGYKLVGTNFTGCNAFFVRDDIVGDKFFEPFTAESHYQPPRYRLYKKEGHKRDFGAFNCIT